METLDEFAGRVCSEAIIRYYQTHNSDEPINYEELHKHINDILTELRELYTCA